MPFPRCHGSGICRCVSEREHPFLPFSHRLVEDGTPTLSSATSSATNDAACSTHHAGAVPLDLLKEEQDRIARRLAFLDAQIDAGQIEYDQAKAHLEDCLALAGDMHAIYMSIDDSLRRICNQAFFERIHVYEIENTDRVEAEPGEPFDTLLDPAIHAAALAYEASARGRMSNLRTPLHHGNGGPSQAILSASEGRPGRSRNLGRHDTRGQVVRNPAKSQTRLSPRRRAELVAAYQAGEPVRTIAARFGVHRGTVSEFIRQAGVPPREPGLDAAGRARAASLYESGLTLAQVAEEVAASVETVRSAVLAEGGTIRPRGQVPRHHKALNLLAAN